MRSIFHFLRFICFHFAKKNPMYDQRMKITIFHLMWIAQPFSFSLFYISQHKMFICERIFFMTQHQRQWKCFSFSCFKLLFHRPSHENVEWKAVQKEGKHEKGVNVTANQPSQQNENFLLSNGPWQRSERRANEGTSIIWYYLMLFAPKLNSFWRENNEPTPPET